MSIKIKRGLPYASRFRIHNGKLQWANLTDFEVRSQLREEKDVDSPLIANLHTFMSKSYGTGEQANDIIIDFVMTGSDTRTLTADGYFDVIVSDPGVTDARGLQIYSGRIVLSDLTTSPEGLT